MPYKDPEIARVKALERVKRYQERHPERVREQRKRTKLKNKEKIDAYMQVYKPLYHERVRIQPFQCSCGRIIKKRNLPIHLRSKIHQTLLSMDYQDYGNYRRKETKDYIEFNW